MFDPTSYRRNFLKQKQYLRLLEDLKVMIEAVQADGEDLSESRDLLKCMACGAFEDTSVVEASLPGEPSKSVCPGDFIIIEAKQKVVQHASRYQKLNVYTYICPVCGLYQNGLVKSKLT